MKKPLIYVITAEPERHDSKYWDIKGTKTILPLAAEFYSRPEAEEFADKKGIIIDGAMNSVVIKP
jgi:hypothetical protein